MDLISTHKLFYEMKILNNEKILSRKNEKTRIFEPQKHDLGHFLTSDVIRQITTFLSWAIRLIALMKSFSLGSSNEKFFARKL